MKHIKNLLVFCAVALCLLAGLVSCDQSNDPPSDTTVEDTTAQSESFSTEEITTETEHIHTYTDTVVVPTCTDKGYTTHVCTECMHSYVDEEVEALGHDYIHSVTDPTCTEAGYTDYMCTRCGDTYTGDEVEPLGHDYEVLTYEPTCTEKGYTVFMCRKCYDSYEGDVTEALGHDFHEDITAPTCTSNGYTYFECTRCAYYKYDNEVPAIGHSYVHTVTAPTCTSEGYTEHECEHCGDYDIDSFTDRLPHDWGEWVTTRKATCTRTGSRMHTCSACQLTETETIDTLPHTYESTVIEPTCTERGYIEHVCSVCEDTYKDNYMDALGHDWGKFVRDEEAGMTYAPCRECEAKRQILYIDAYYNGERMLTGETVAQEDVVVAAVLNDGSSFDVTEFTLSSASIQTAGDNEVSISYLGLTTSISVPAIWGNDPMANPASDFYYTKNGDSITITGYTGSRANVVIPAHIGRVPVSSIGVGAFAGTNIQIVFIPNSIVFISGSSKIYNDDGAFTNCKSLKTLVIGSGLSSINQKTFAGCSALENVTIGSSVITIGQSAFSGCTALSEIDIPTNITTIAQEAFAGCSSLKKVVLHEGLQSIGLGAFSNTRIENLTIPDSVTFISGSSKIYNDDGAFTNCKSLKTLVIGSGLSSINQKTFAGCSALENVTIGSSVITIGQSAFSGCTALSEIDIPTNITTIAQEAFAGCSSLKKVVLHEGLQSIGIRSFASTPLETIFIPNSVTHISGSDRSYDEEGSFNNCTKLKTVIFGTGLQALAYRAFYNCNSITQIYYTGTEELWNAFYINEGNGSIKTAPITFNYKPE